MQFQQIHSVNLKLYYIINCKENLVTPINIMHGFC